MTNPPSVNAATTAATTCEMAGCDREATARPTYDANPDRAARKMIGTVAICDPCQGRIDKVNARIKLGAGGTK